MRSEAIFVARMAERLAGKVYRESTMALNFL